MIRECATFPHLIKYIVMGLTKSTHFFFDLMYNVHNILYNIDLNNVLVHKKKALKTLCTTQLFLMIYLIMYLF